MDVFFNIHLNYVVFRISVQEIQMFIIFFSESTGKLDSNPKSSHRFGPWWDLITRGLASTPEEYLRNQGFQESLGMVEVFFPRAFNNI